MKTAFLTFLAMLAFAGNSFICRFALANKAIDPISFTSIRLISGAVGLLLIIFIADIFSIKTSGSTTSQNNFLTRYRFNKNNLFGSLMLFIYAALFSLAYVELDSGTGALLLFGSVQLTMIGFNLYKGNKTSPMEAFGVSLAVIGFIILLSPNEFSPNIKASCLMILSGVAWAFYTLNGQTQSSCKPIINTAKNFMLTIPWLLVVVFCLYCFFNFKASLDLSQQGVLLAVTSGVITSALGYSIWYAVLPKLRITVAACSQLSVPVLAFIGGFVLIDETLSTRSLVASFLTLLGIAVTILCKKPLFDNHLTNNR